MFAQLHAVWITYRSRKLLWLLAAIYAFFTFASYMSPPRRFSVLGPQMETHWLPRQEFQGMTTFLDWNASDEQLRELKGLKIEGSYFVQWNPPADQPDARPPLPHLEHLKPGQSYMVDDHSWTAEHFEKLGRCTALRELRLLSVELTPELGAVLAKLQNLRELELTLIGSPTPSLEHLPTLSNLSTFRVPWVPLSDLGLLAKHPNLRLIELPDHPAPKPIPGALSFNEELNRWSKPSTLHEATQLQQVIICPQSEYMQQLAERVPHQEIPTTAFSQTVPVNLDLCKELARLPNLTDVEVRSASGSWPSEMIEDSGVRAALAERRPAVKLNPSQSESMGIALILGGQCTLLLACLLGWQLVAQMGSAWSRVLPGYARPHLTFALVILAAHVVIQSMFIMRRNNDAALFPSLALATILPALISVMFAYLSRHLTLLPFFGFLPVIFIGIGALSLKLFTPPRLDAFLDGELIMQATVLLAVNLGAIAWSWRRWPELARSLAELGVATGQGWFRFQQQLQMKFLSNTEAKVSMPSRMLDQQIERVSSFTDFSTTPARITRWRCGEPTLRKRGIILFGLLMPLLFCCISFGVYSFLSQTPFDLKKILFFTVLSGPLTATFGMWMLAGGMLGRRPLLSQELMRPVSRQEFTSYLAWSLWHDFWPSLLIALGYALCIPLVLPLAPENSILNTPLLSSYVVYCPASAAFIWLAVLLVMTIQRTWLRTFYLILVGIVELISLQFGVILIAVGDRSFPISWVIPEILLGFLLVTAIVGWLAFRRLPQVEWGRQC